MQQRLQHYGLIQLTELGVAAVAVWQQSYSLPAPPVSHFKGCLGLRFCEVRVYQIKSNYFIVRLKVDQRAGQLSLPHLGITKTEK